MKHIAVRVHHFAQSRPKTTVGIAILGILLLGAVVLVVTQSYPIALVNGVPVTARQFNNNYRAANAYYQYLLKNRPAGTEFPSTISLTSLEAQVLEELIVSVLIEQGARNELGSDLDRLVIEKIAPHESNKELKASAQTLYNMDFQDFRREILVPQAKRDVLAGRLYLRGEPIEDWLNVARASADVYILSPKFRWDGGRVIAPQS